MASILGYMGKLHFRTDSAAILIDSGVVLLVVVVRFWRFDNHRPTLGCFRAQRH